MSYDRGNDHFVAGRYAEAEQEYRAALAAGSDDPDLYENLGLALWKQGYWRAAARALLRVLDGGADREQALRVLVSCLFRAGQPLDGERLLRVYEEKFGAHPERWTNSS